MNWSTRLRRWVRIRMPPVREASMKPTAATVLPAPVACSNQKRRSAPGSSGATSTASSSSSSAAGSSQSWGSSSGASSSASASSSSVVRLVVVRRRRLRPRPRRRQLLRRHLLPRRVFRLGLDLGRLDRRPVLGGGLLLGHQLGQRPGEGVHLVRVEFGAVEQLRRFVGEQALEPEQQREVAPPLDRRVLGPVVELGEGGVECPAAGGARRQRLGALAVEQERLAGERRRALDIGA